MMNLKMVNDNSVDDAAAAENGGSPAEDGNHGTMVLKELVEPWEGIGEIVVALDSYF